MPRHCRERPPCRSGVTHDKTSRSSGRDAGTARRPFPTRRRTSMPRPVILFSGSWADLSLEELAAQAAEWGYNGLELACWGDHFEVQRAAGEEDYASGRLEMLRRL